MVTRHVVNKFNVPRPPDSKTHPTSAGDVDDELVLLQLEQSMAFIGDSRFAVVIVAELSMPGEGRRRR
jgi:hypothetical protein